jgi:hypothetical protein
LGLLEMIAPVFRMGWGPVLTRISWSLPVVGVTRFGWLFGAYTILLVVKHEPFQPSG